MEKTPLKPDSIPDLAAGLLKLDYSTIAADVRERVRASTYNRHDEGVWRAQFNRVLGDRLRRESGIELDLLVSRIGIEILWNYFWQIWYMLDCVDHDFREAKDTIIEAVTEMAQHGAMLSQTKFLTIEDTRPAIRGESASPFIVTRSDTDNTISIAADPALLEQCRRAKEANLDQSTRHCPAVASMREITESLYDAFFEAMREESQHRCVSEIEYC